MKAQNTNRYRRPSEGKDYGDSFVGIFWVTGDNTVIPISCPVNRGRNDGVEISMQGVSHQTSFLDALKKWAAPSVPDGGMLELKYYQFERGRVVYDLKTSSYIVTMSPSLKDDAEAILNIVKAFHLHEETTVFTTAQLFAKQ